MIIGIYSSTPQQGKSTIARHLVQVHGYHRVPFAETMKLMVGELLYDLGVGYSIGQEMMNGDKSDVIYKDKTLRHVLQTLSTEWGRMCMGSNFWVDVWKRKVELKAGIDIVVDDMRFPNEFHAVKTLGGLTWKVVRPGASAPTNGHASEGVLDIEEFDAELVNAGTLDDLVTTVETALKVGKAQPS